MLPPGNNQDIVQSLDSIARVLGQPARITSYRYNNGTAARSTNGTGLFTSIPGLTVQYTAPNYPVSVFLLSSVLMSNSASSAVTHAIGHDFVASGFSAYRDTNAGSFYTYTTWSLVQLDPNATATFTGLYKSNAGTLSVTNMISDATINNYNNFLVAEFRRGNV